MKTQAKIIRRISRKVSIPKAKIKPSGKAYSRKKLPKVRP